MAGGGHGGAVKAMVLVDGVVKEVVVGCLDIGCPIKKYEAIFGPIVHFCNACI